ncbi:cytochrome P450 [Actinoplanes lutulentus]|uniref:Cytochrome P450 n=1 Tax=Actinoplanes lutulentus TaxID=1287878 RepID=A0A327ZC62_9ACTN|nr:cytochrome P450 [Actinoplanes lutulentus]MBB2941368.1 cytochrome P450 [Actinoplanes lutulentus]RAK36860.1 cytochrome P450 [Actinoplanes lutulentus]
MTHASAMRRARRRDRRVYLGSHPFLFALLAATRRRPATRIGRTVIAHSRAAFVDGLLRVPLDRTAEGTTGGAAGRLTGGGLLFDQEGDDHRASRRDLADALSAEGVARLRPIWTGLLTDRLAPLAAGHPIDLVDIAADLSGTTTAAMLGLAVDGRDLATAARAAAAAGARDHLPGLPHPGARKAAEAAAANLNNLLTGGDAMAAMLAVAAINTTVAALPRAAAWCADANLWPYAETAVESLVTELLRATTPTPLLPRVAAGSGTVAGCPVTAGDRLVLVARHAVDAHSTDPNPADPAPPHVAQLVFGAGPHACPGARMARAQMADTLAALAPYRPTVVSARADRRSALPGWSSLILAPAR